MAHWNAYYESSQTSDDQYPSLSTTVSSAASHFESRMPGDAEFGHAVANILGAFAGSQPQSVMMHPEYSQQFEDFYCTASRPDTYIESEEVVIYSLGCTCMCISNTVYVHVPVCTNVSVACFFTVTVVCAQHCSM